MLTRICSALALFLALSSSAAATTWQFRYQGFLDGESGAFLPDAKLDGHFSGSDDDGDGVISLAELTGFYVSGHEYVNPNCSVPGVGKYCSLDAFSYRLTGALAFDATESYYDVIGHSNRYIANDRIVSSHYDPYGNEYRSVRYWTPATTFTITPPPVPEPSMAALALAGLLALLWRHRHGAGGRDTRS